MLRLRALTLCALAALSATACGDDTSGVTTSTSAGAGGGGSGGDDADGGPTTDAVTTGEGSTGSSDATSTGSGDGGAGGSSTSSGDPEADGDGDGFTDLEGDCNDVDPEVNPGATEICNLVDDDCDGEQDEGFDVDGDGFTSCGLDCDDAVATTKPGADELALGQNGVDDDCNGIVDEPWQDLDLDGFSEAAGDCDDAQPEINPDALEFPSNGADDDCDGVVDEALQPCDGGALDSNNPLDYARAIGLCNGEVEGATFVTGQAVTRSIVTSYGSFGMPMNVPTEGSRFVHLSSGRADGSTKDAGYGFDGNTGGACSSFAHPQPLGDPPGDCAAADPANVCDKTEVQLQIRVPSNALSFSYQFQFYSAEYMTYRCTQFDDTFLALLSSQALNGGAPTNISFDTNGNVISVNTGFFEICYDDLFPAPANLCSTDPVAPLGGTGFSANSAGATRPLTTTSPVEPGELITLRFVIFDEGDDQLDSSVVIDNFQWSLDAADGPSTEE